MKYFNICILAITLISCGQLFGQGIKIEKDPRIDALVSQLGTIKPPATGPQIKGFRVQLTFDSNKKEIDAARMKFVASHPKVDTYVEYNAPNYTLRVGDFRTKSEAEKLKSEIERLFPTSFIVEELIYLPRLD